MVLSQNVSTSFVSLRNLSSNYVISHWVKKKKDFSTYLPNLVCGSKKRSHLKCKDLLLTLSGSPAVTQPLRIMLIHQQEEGEELAEYGGEPAGCFLFEIHAIISLLINSGFQHSTDLMKTLQTWKYHQKPRVTLYRAEGKLCLWRWRQQAARVPSQSLTLSRKSLQSLFLTS